MRYTEAWGMPFSDPDTWILVLGITDLKSGIAVTFVVISGYSQFVQMVVDGRLMGEPIYVTAGVVTTMTGSYSNVSNHTYSIEGLGPFATNRLFDVTEGQILFAKARPDRLHAEITAVPMQFSVDGPAA